MPVEVERAGRVATLTVPPVLNRDVVGELDELTRGLEGDRSVGAIVLTGREPGVFVASYDVGEMLSGAELTPPLPEPVLAGVLRTVGALTRLPGAQAVLGRTPAAGLVTLLRLHGMYQRMGRMDKVVVAAINGSAPAVGCELALACDIRLMADGDFGIGLTEPVLGFNPGGGGGQRLARTLGPARAVELLLEGRLFAPREAAEAGLVHRVVAAERLAEEAHELAARLARRSPHVIAAVKRIAYRGASGPWPRSFRVDAAAFVSSAVAPATKDAMRAFLRQGEELAPERVSPWVDDEALRAWQEGTVVDFSDGRNGR